MTSASSSAPARPRRGRGCGARSRVLPAAGRDPAGPGRRDRGHSRCGAVLRPLLPARVRPAAEADAPVRRLRRLPGAARADPRAGARGGRALELHRRLPRRDRGRPRRRCARSSSEARLDAIGVFGYSDEDGTEAASYDAKLDADEVRDRVEHVTGLVEEITAQRAEDRIGEQVEVLVESVGGRRGGRPGRSTRVPRSTGRRTSSERARGRRPGPGRSRRHRRGRSHREGHTMNDERPRPGP